MSNQISTKKAELTEVRLSDCYSVHVHKHTLSEEQVHVRITETFSGSKTPGEHRRIWDITASPNAIRLLGNAIARCDA